jgi:integrin-linked kinase-associated serine/threonine phosphatase 2C
MNKSKKINSKISDVPFIKVGCDDITAVIAFLDF